MRDENDWKFIVALILVGLCQVLPFLFWPKIAKADNSVFIDQVSGDSVSVIAYQEGTNNKLTLKMSGDGNNVSTTQYDNSEAKLGLNGGGNLLTLLQSGSSSTPHYAETNISGTNNTLNSSQTGNANQYMFTTISGNNNSVTSSQSGTASHSLTATLTGNGNSLLSSQLGSSSNSANVNLTNAGGPSSLDLQQTGGNTLNFTQYCTNPAGCASVVRQ